MNAQLKEKLEEWMLRHLIVDIDALEPNEFKRQMLADIEARGDLSEGYIKLRIVGWLDKWVEETHEVVSINYLDGIVDDVRQHYFPIHEQYYTS
jgi:hypothetical protein